MATATQFSSHSTNAISAPGPSTMTADFDTQAVAVDVATNFDERRRVATSGDDSGHEGDASSRGDSGRESHRGGDGDEDDGSRGSHFDDIAQLAAMETAKAIESVDMDRLCSELFSQEMLTQEMLEEAVASATGIGAAELAALANEAGAAATHQGAINSGATENGVVTAPQATQGAGKSVGGKSGVVTDCSSSTDGSEGSVPSTIEVVKAFQPPGFPAKAPIEAAPQLRAVPKAPSSPKKSPKPSPLGPQVLPSLKAIQGASRPPAPGLQFSVQQAKRQRVSAAAGAPAPSAHHVSRPVHGFNGIAAPPMNRAAADLMAHPSIQARAAPTVQPAAQVNAMSRVHPAPGYPVLPTAQAAMMNSQAALAANSVPKVSNQDDEVICARCHFPGADVKINCPSGCSYHARCMDLMSVCREVGSKNDQGDFECRACPSCRRPSNGMEILPLSFKEMDRVQQSARAAFSMLAGNMGAGASGGKGGNDTLSRMDPLPTSIPSHAGAQPRRTVQCYDPAQPRTGRWTDEEILFRDTLIQHFLSGSLPLSNGLKLNDFLPIMLKSKQSRLAKKMKHAKLSTKYFYPKSGAIILPDSARELSRMEREFVSSIPDAVERSEVRFHMGREWREHFANRCHSLRVAFDGRAWLSSVEDMERRLAFERERHRLAKRRFMMGKAMEEDAERRERGVFVNEGGDGREEFELVVEKSVSNSAGSGLPSGGACRDRDAAGVWSSQEPNFKHAAPFLAGIASYVERNGVPFEHVDVWVPSYVENGTEGVSTGTRGSGAAPSGRGDGSPSPDGNFRLCFGGSVTMGVQMSSEDRAEGAASPGSSPRSSPGPSGAGPRRLPLSGEDKSNFSLFGDYSAKFSFSPGCGLPGRIFESGTPAWEQFVSDAHPSLFERRGGALQFGIKTALGLPVDSPNVGRVVLVLYSKFDRSKDERLVGRMLCDLKLLNPCPRWKLVVDVDTPSGAVSGGAVSSMQAPPREVKAGTGSPALAATTISRGTSLGSATSAPGQVQVNHAQAPAAQPATSKKESQIKSLILLLASNIPSDMNSPLGQQLQGIMSLRLILLRGDRRTTEEEGLVDTVLVLYESYLAAGRSERDIAVMVARDFTFHLGHLGGLAREFGCPPPGQGRGMMPAPAQRQASPVYGARQAQRQTSPVYAAQPPPVPAFQNARNAAPQVHDPRSPVLNYGAPPPLPAGNQCFIRQNSSASLASRHSNASR